MSSLDTNNLRTIIAACRGVLREDFVEAMEASAAEYDRLQDVVRVLQHEVRELRRAKNTG